MDDESRVTPPFNGTRLPVRQRLSVKRRLKPAASVSPATDHDMEELSARRLALFEPLGPSSLSQIGSPESVIPPPDFEPSSNPRDWVLGKKRKLVNVDVVESMRRIAVQEMNRKDREINGLNEQLEEDGRTMELIQMQLQQERSKRQQVERENAVLQGKVNMLMAYLQETEEGEAMSEDGEQGHSADPGATRLRP